MLPAIQNKISLAPIDIIATWLRGRGPCTLRAYQADVENFAGFVGCPDANSAAQHLISNGPGHANRLVLAYRATMLEHKLAPNTINRRLSTLRSLAKMARIVGLITWGLEVENVRSQPYRDTRGPEESGFKRIKRQTEKRRDTKGLRDQAIILLLHDIALRRGEVVQLDLSDYDPVNRTLALLRKGNREQTRLSLPDRTNTAIIEWLDVRGWEQGPLFISLHRNRVDSITRMSGTAIWKLTQKLGDCVGIQDLHPHSLRHTAITTAIERAQSAGLGLEKVLPFSGHAKLATLQIYADQHQNYQGQIADLVAR
jgi:integrase/recombinase XerC